MTIRVAIIGLGNCASSFVQGLQLYRDVSSDSAPTPGIMHNSFGGYLIRDISIVCAFDINANKVGKDVCDAIWQVPNTQRRICSVPPTGVIVQPGMVLDGLAPHLQNHFPTIEAANADVLTALTTSRAEMCVSYLPVGSRQATDFYASSCLSVGIAFINGIPEPIASDLTWEHRFRQAKLPCAGDDIQSQIGATIVHRTLIDLIRQRGSLVTDSYQLDIGGNMDFCNMMDSSRALSKQASKTYPVAHDAVMDSVTIAPAQYIKHLEDSKIAYINVRGLQFASLPFEIELKMRVEDSPNNAGVMIDVVRAMKLSLDRKLAGYQDWSAYYFKRPLVYRTLSDARAIVDRFIGDFHGPSSESPTSIQD